MPWCSHDKNRAAVGLLNKALNLILLPGVRILGRRTRMCILVCFLWHAGQREEKEHEWWFKGGDLSWGGDGGGGDGGGGASGVCV